MKSYAETIFELKKKKKTSYFYMTPDHNFHKPGCRESS